MNAFAAALVAAAEDVIAGVASVNGETGTLTGFSSRDGHRNPHQQDPDQIRPSQAPFWRMFTPFRMGPASYRPRQRLEQFWTWTTRRPRQTLQWRGIDGASDRGRHGLRGDGRPLALCWVGGSAPTLRPTDGEHHPRS